ncbi:12934_t:CDS:2, partial [Racocetra fulgida]
MPTKRPCLCGKILRNQTKNSVEQLEKQQQNSNSNQEPTIVLSDTSVNNNQTEAIDLASSTTNFTQTTSNILLQENTEMISELNTDSSSEILTTEQWDSVIMDWTDMLNSKNYLTDGESIQEEPLNFKFVDFTIHLADDLLAKWNLTTLFNNTLDASVFLK